MPPSFKSFATVAAYETISQLQDEVMFVPIKEGSDDVTENLVLLRQNALVSILSRAKPLTGRGYFIVDKSMIISIIGAATTYIIVLLQFNMSEKPDLGRANNTALGAPNDTI